MNPSLVQRRKRDALCDQFEQEWIVDNHLTIESFIETLDVDIDEPTFEELLIVEIDLRYSHFMSPKKLSLIHI